MSRKWPFSVLTIGGVALTLILSGPGVSANVDALAVRSLSATRTPARYRVAIQDRFIRSFAAARAYPRLSQLNMDLFSTFSGLPRYAPGSDPLEKVKADRDQHGTHLGSLFISDRGLTLNLF